MNATQDTAGIRPRVEGEREQEILQAALEVLSESGYDNLTMDAVAHRAKASKATLYRRWSGKAALTIDALCSQKEDGEVPDTGTLRGDLLARMCEHGGTADKQQLAIFASVITALGHDEEFADAFRHQFIGPKIARSREIYERAVARGEVAAEVDIDLLVTALSGVVLHRVFVLGEPPTDALIAHVIDQLILPAVTHGPANPEPHNKKDMS